MKNFINNIFTTDYTDGRRFFLFCENLGNLW
ncbi:hypothetical protein BACOV975_03305 [Bacteroides ovatus V975]|nr:hypothetical protein HMPREF0102_02875 [Bacteroides sp. 2_1_22]SCV09511.1 hypothetical protein BACOV975_03305 [Bacteroides ovatus V975]